RRRQRLKRKRAPAAPSPLLVPQSKPGPGGTRPYERVNHRGADFYPIVRERTSPGRRSGCLSGAAADETALVQDLCDLDRVGRRALEQVVRDDPQAQPALV